jgi:hypothetical protein
MLSMSASLIEIGCKHARLRIVGLDLESLSILRGETPQV